MSVGHPIPTPAGCAEGRIEWSTVQDGQRDTRGQTHECGNDANATRVLNVSLLNHRYRPYRQPRVLVDA
jgi:hypothetical protein